MISFQIMYDGICGVNIHSTRYYTLRMQIHEEKDRKGCNEMNLIPIISDEIETTCCYDFVVYFSYLLNKFSIIFIMLFEISFVQTIKRSPNQAHQFF